jgi:hypothetical protein
LQWLEECGHVGHLEKPDEVAGLIASFLLEEVEAIETTDENQLPYAIGAGVVGTLALAEIANLLLQ